MCVVRGRFLSLLKAKGRWLLYHIEIYGIKYKIRKAKVKEKEKRIQKFWVVRPLKPTATTRKCPIGLYLDLIDLII
jgi:hypothetical protein